ncbi:MAG: DUF2007 domain-containing protein [Proteobacteria bacterium]|nr:DUF2007 domain-containing protein [Pseudomonadota bacterium]
MHKKLGLAFLLTVLIQSLIYDQLGSRPSWNGSLFIIVLFLAIYTLLNRGSVKNHGLLKNRTANEGKILDLNQFRQKKELQSRSEDETQSEMNRWTPLFISNDSSKMELVHSLLTSYNIDCHISNRHVASLYPSIEGLDMILQVNPEDQERCIEILKQHDLQPGKS